MRFLLLLAAFLFTSSQALAQFSEGDYRGVAPTINEVRLDQPGGDDDEYFELWAPGGAGQNFPAGAAYIVIGDGTGGSGVIEAVVDLGGVPVGANEFFTAAEATFTLGVADLTTDLNFENSDNVTHMLVSGFSGSNGDDLDTDDDGVLDVTPWSAMESCIALVETFDIPASGEHIYCADTVGPDGTFVPGHAYVSGCCSANGGPTWIIGPFDPVGGEDTPDFQNMIPVELVSFEATVNGSDIDLSWLTSSETNNAGFEVQLRGDGSYQAMGFVDGHGTTTEQQSYSYTIPDLAPGTYTVRLKQIDYDGAFEYSPEVEVAVGVPGSHILTQAYPNPFNPQATFSLSVATEQHVEIGLYNSLGQKVDTIFNGTMAAGNARSFTINGAGLPSGAYYYRAIGTNFAETGRVMLLK
ncbi:MAG: T9SS type A sorting domain-containing protein [Rubricoccaceae bacterium]|nr:T9SS type A sorting domain-containing protein [Rubricoccaceae bacterium]